MRRLGLVCVMLALWSLTGCAIFGARKAREVSVTGTAVTRTVPDVIAWNIMLTDLDKDLGKAQANNERKLAEVRAIVGKLGVKPEDLQTGQLSIAKNYQRDNQGNPVSFRHFEVRRSLTFRLKELGRFDAVYSALAAIGDVEVSYAFESSKQEQLRMETRVKAVKIAKKKARAMAQAAGAKLGRVTSIDEEVKPAAWSPMGGGYMANNVSFEAPGSSTPDVNLGSLAPGTIEVKVSVSAKFELK